MNKMRYRVHALLVPIAAVIICSVQSCKPKSQTSIQPPTARADNHAQNDRDGMILINGGNFLMGTEDAMPYEAPAHEVTVKSFWIDRHEVTVAEFAKFVAATGYQTASEKRKLAEGESQELVLTLKKVSEKKQE